MSLHVKDYIADGSTKIFSSDFNVISESHIMVTQNNDSEDVVSKELYDLINDAVVFKEASAHGYDGETSWTNGSIVGGDWFAMGVNS